MSVLYFQESYQNVQFFCQLLDIDDGFLSLMDDAGNTRDDLKVPEGDIGEEIVREHGDGKDLLVSLLNSTHQ